MSSLVRHMRVTVEGKAYDVTVELLDEPAGRPVNLVPPRVEAPSRPEPRPEPAVARPLPPPPPPAPVARGGRPVPSPLSGMVVSVDVVVGQKVAPGDLLVTLEAMKMKAPIPSPLGGTIVAVHARIGVAVEEGAALVVVG